MICNRIAWVLLAAVVCLIPSGCGGRSGGLLPGDGRTWRIAFQSYRDGNAEIYVMNADGSGQTRLTDNPAHDALPVWSPGGREIAFQSNRDGDTHIYLMASDGSDQTRLIEGGSPDWSSDGRIAFRGLDGGAGDIHVVAPEGSGLTNLTQSPANDRSPAWSPDAQSIAFDSGPSVEPHVWVMNANGSDQTELTAGEDPAWSPDGSRLAFSHGHPIFLIDLDGGGLTDLTMDFVSCQRPAWSPDGAWIAYDRPTDGNQEVYIIGTDGLGLTRLTSDPSDDLCPAWSPVRLPRLPS